MLSVTSGAVSLLKSNIIHLKLEIFVALLAVAIGIASANITRYFPFVLNAIDLIFIIINSVMPSIPLHRFAFGSRAIKRLILEENM